MAANSLAIANMALSHIGAKSIAILDGTEDTTEAEQCYIWYDQCRKETLAAVDWKFARTRLALTPHGDPVPDGEWPYRFVYPSTCVQMRRIENLAGKRSKEIAFDIEATQQRDAVTDGGMADATAWTAGSGWVVSGGVATATTASSDLEQTIVTTVYPGLIEGASYILIFTATRSAGSVTPKVGGTSGTSRSSSATFTETIVAGDSGLLEFTGSGFTGTIDTVSLTPIAVGESILTVLEEPVAVFTADVSTTTRFTPLFDLALSYLLASRIVYPITKKRSIAIELMGVAQGILTMAAAINHNEEIETEPRDADIITGRL